MALLDTHTFLWAITGHKALSPTARRIFDDNSSELWFSAAGVWEILVKAAIGKLQLPEAAGSFITQQLMQNSIEVLSIQLPHVLRLESLPVIHRDPFDRILVAQAIQESLPIITGDPLIKRYPVDVIW